MPDVNGTTYQLLLGEADWARCGPAPYERRWRYDQPRELLTLRPLPFQFAQPTGDGGLSGAERRGATRDRYGHWYWVGPDERSIVVRWAGGRGPEHFWPPMDDACAPAGPTFRPREQADPVGEMLRGLAATTGHYLVAGVAGGLLVFDLHTGGPPTRLALPPARPGAPTLPFDLAPTADGGVVVLDRANRVAWVLDATFRPQPPPAPGPREPLLFQARGASPPRVTTPSAAPAPVDLSACARPVSVEPLPDGSLLVLDQPEAGPGTIRRYIPGAAGPPEAVPLTPEALGDPAEPPLSLGPIRAHDIAFVPASGRPDAFDALFVVDAGGNQAFALRLALAGGLRLRVEPRFYPMRAVTGKALVAPLGAGHAYYDQGDLWLPLAELPRRRYEDWAELRTPPLDGHVPGCVWHRLCLDACLPPTARVTVASRAADEVALLPLQPWQPEPALYRRGGGSELPYQSLWARDELRQADAGTWELLLQRAEGRYLELRLTLEGDGRSTPAIRGLRAHYPRFSYARAYLPPLYQEDRASLDFLERFLANPEGLLTVIEGLIADAHAFLDPRTVPEEAVAWLGAWLGLAFDPAWSDHQRRLLLANAPYFFQRRGTVAGITQAIRVAINPDAGPAIFQDQQEGPRAQVRLVEHFHTRHFSRAALGDSTGPDEALTGDVRADARARAHRFTVLVPATICAGRIAGAEGLIERIVAAEKPAHTAFTLRRFWALFRVGEARVGLDTALGAGGRFTPITLDATALAEGYLEAAYPSNLSDRVVLDR